MEYGPGKKKMAILLAALFLLLVIIAGVCSIRIREITVTGNEKYTDEQVVDLVFPDNASRSTVLCYLREHFGKHEKIPFVEDYKLVFQNPFHVQVIIHEKTVVGYVSYMSSYMYFDKDGIIVESSSQKLHGIPWITGLKFGHIVLYQKLPVESERVFEEILNLTQILSIYDLSVDKIQYNTLGEATLYMGEIEVILGSNEVLNGKIAELGDMLPQLEGKSGILYLDTYDETRTNPMYTFKPKG